MKEYTFVERLKYTMKRNWFCSKYVFGIKVPYIATNWDIFIDLAWRDVKQSTKKMKIIYNSEQPKALVKRKIHSIIIQRNK